MVLTSESYQIDTPFMIGPKLYIGANTKRITSGSGNVELLRIIPGAVGAYFCYVTCYAYVPNGTDEQRLKEFRSQYYIMQKTLGTVTEMGCFDQAVNSDYSHSIVGGTDFVLNISRNSTFDKDVTIEIKLLLSFEDTGTTDVIFSTAV